MQIVTFGRDILLLTGSRNKLLTDELAYFQLHKFYIAMEKL